MTPQTLCIAVTFLTGRYHGEEWPPSPARLYQALLAGVTTCGYREYAPMVEPALRWLETQRPPQIRTTDSQDSNSYRIAVPNNDTDVVAREWVSGRQANPADFKTMKTIQARQLDASGPHVQYVWTVDSSEAEPLLQPLRTAALCLHTLGWGVDMAYADLRAEVPSAITYEPSVSGERFAVPMPGTLDDLHATYCRFTKRTTGEGVDTHTRPSMLRMQPYRSTGERIMPVARFMLLKPDSDEVKAVAWQNCMKVAGWLRHAAAQSARGEVDDSLITEYIQGHTAAEEKSRRISYLPLPSIYGRYGDGAIRRVILSEPDGATGEINRLLGLKLAGRGLTDTAGEMQCYLAPAPSNDWTFDQYIPRAGKTVWRSVTPVVLHGFNVARRGAISVGKTERLLLRAFHMAGFNPDDIASFAFQSAPFWSGSRHASAIRVPDHLDGYPRLHVEVRFKRPVKGPVTAGIGRHYGIGLFATAPASS